MVLQTSRIEVAMASTGRVMVGWSDWEQQAEGPGKQASPKADMTEASGRV